MKFLVDAQLPHRLATHLQSLGHDVSSHIRCHPVQIAVHQLVGRPLVLDGQFDQGFIGHRYRRCWLPTADNEDGDPGNKDNRHGKPLGSVAHGSKNSHSARHEPHHVRSSNQYRRA